MLKKNKEVEEFRPIFYINPRPQIIELPDTKDRQNLDITYTLIEPYVNAHIFWDKINNELVYNVEEPILDKKENEVLKILENGIYELINISFIGIKSTGVVIEYLEKNIRVLLNELKITISRETYLKLMYYIYRDFVGLNEVEPLLRDYHIEDIECNGVNTPIYIVHRKYRNLRTNVIFKDINKLTSFVEKLAQKCGKYISYASPLLDGSLPDGSRVNATYAQDISSKGPSFTLRKFTKEPWTPIKLMQFKTVSPEILAYLWLLIENESNIMIIGGTGSGKTSFLNSIAFFIPPAARVVSIEDSITGDSEIIYKNKDKIEKSTINKLSKQIDKNRIKIKDIEVLTLDEDMKVIFGKPSKFIKHLTKKDIYKVTTSTGRVVEVTKDHSLFTLSTNGLIEVKPENLEENISCIAVPRYLPIEGKGIFRINLFEHLKHFNEDFLVGKPINNIFEKYNYKYFNVPKSTYRWWKKRGIIPVRYFKNINYNFNKEELKYLFIKSKNTTKIPVIFEFDNDFIKFIGLWVGDGSHDNYNKNRIIISCNEPDCVELYKRISKRLNINISFMNDNWSWCFNSTVFYKFIKYVLKLDWEAKDKIVPDFAYNFTNEQLKNFISGYFSADGTVKKYEVSCSSKSKNIINSVQTLLLRLGIISRIGKTPRDDGCIDLRVSSYDNLNKFKEIGFIQKRQNDKLYLNGNSEPTHANSDILPINPNWFEELSNFKSYFKNYSGCNDSFPGTKFMKNFIVENEIDIPKTCFEFLDKFTNSDVLWDKVVKIEKLPKKERYVYDISVPDTEKFISQNIILHNTRELNLLHENWLPGVTREGIGASNILGTKEGDVTLFDLLKESFRQRPDYVIVGEIRGKEAYVLFQGMSSGHPSFGTMHAEDVETMVRRLETPPIELSASLVQSLDVVCVIGQAKVQNKELRKIKEVVEIINVREGVGNIETNTPFVWDPRNDKFYFKNESKVFDKIVLHKGINKEKLYDEFLLRTKLLMALYNKNIVGFKEVYDIINAYYKTPELVLKKFNIS